MIAFTIIQFISIIFRKAWAIKLNSRFTYKHHAYHLKHWRLWLAPLRKSQRRGFQDLRNPEGIVRKLKIKWSVKTRYSSSPCHPIKLIHKVIILRYQLFCSMAVLWRYMEADLLVDILQMHFWAETLPGTSRPEVLVMTWTFRYW